MFECFEFENGGKRRAVQLPGMAGGFASSTDLAKRAGGRYTQSCL